MSYQYETQLLYIFDIPSIVNEKPRVSNKKNSVSIKILRFWVGGFVVAGIKFIFTLYAVISSHALTENISQDFLLK